jgi:bla regulator protein BlaR1
MSGLFETVLRLSLAGSLTAAVIWVSVLLLRQRLPKAWLYCLWLAAVLRFMIPVSFALPFSLPSLAVFPVPAPAVSPAAADALPDTGWSYDLSPSQQGGVTVMDQTIPTPAAHRNDVFGLAAVVWPAGAGAMLVWHITGYCLTLRKLKRTRVFLKTDKVPVFESPLISTPLLVGLLRPAVCLPANFPGAGLAVRHELCHLSRGDIWVKWLVQLVVCINWFNPLVYLMKSELNRLSELACDEMVTRRMDASERTAYGRMLLETLRSSSGFGGPMTAALGNNKKWLKERMHGIMKRRIISKKAVMLMIVIVLFVTGTAVLSGAALDGTHTETADITAAPPQQADTPTAFADAPFVHDPDVIGTWEYLAVVPDIETFDPATPPDPEISSLHEIVFAQNGVMNTPGLSWSKGQLMIQYAGKITLYEIRTINGEKYLFFIPSAADNGYLVMKYVSADSTFSITTDDINLPFINDPGVIGTWNTVDFVSDIDRFDPSEKRWQNGLYMTQMVFRSGGVLDGQSTEGRFDTRFSWTKGAVIDPLYHTASAYEIRELDGSTYLFFEWKSGDYTYRHMKPKYYVLEKAD